ncbi:multidrug ABC transporter permease, partial [bacterium]|nr:multidrug ABC transporter permease [bacterium]
MRDLNPKTNTSSPAKVAPAALLSSSAHELRRPVCIGLVNWVGLGTLYQREVQRFLKIATQTLAAPVITSILFLMVFSV